MEIEIQEIPTKNESAYVHFYSGAFDSIMLDFEAYFLMSDTEEKVYGFEHGDIKVKYRAKTGSDNVVTHKGVIIGKFRKVGEKWVFETENKIFMSAEVAMNIWNLLNRFNDGNLKF